VIKIKLGRFGRIDIASPTVLEIAGLALVLVFATILVGLWR
jgi:hypothetical protein